MKTKTKQIKLSRIIPARRKTVKFRWCRKEWMTAGKYNEAREKMNMKPTKKCWWCSYIFADGNMMALAQPEKGRNRLLCQKCAYELLATNKKALDE